MQCLSFANSAEMRFLFLLALFFTVFSLYSEDYKISIESKRTERQKLARFFQRVSSGEFTEDKEKEWALKRSNVLSFRHETAEKAVKNILSERPLSPALGKAVIDYIYSRYTASFQEEIKMLHSEEKDIRLKFLYSLYLEKENPEFASETQRLLEEKFEEKHPYVLGYSVWKNSKNTEKPVSAEDLLTSPFVPGNWIFFSLHRKDNRYPGILVIRKPDGTFLKEKSGSYFHTAHLAFSASGLPFFITFGNTPRGIYFFRDTVYSENSDIGPLPALRLYMPGEIPAAVFFGDRRIKKKWNYGMIQKILPPSLKNNNDFKENYIANTAGRSGIWSHGTAVSPEFFKDAEAYPVLPAVGCFTSPEIWSERSGKLLYSSQLSLLNMMKEHKITKGYLIAVTLNSKEKPVTLEEILPALSLTEE